MQIVLLVPCTNRRYFVPLPIMPLLYCVMYTQYGWRVTKLWNYIGNLVAHLYLWVVWTLKQLTCFLKNVSLASQIGLISSLSSTTDWTSNGLRRLEEVLQKQEVSNLIAALAYKDTKHFLTWLAYPILVNMLSSSGMEKDIDFSLIVAAAPSESRLESRRKWYRWLLQNISSSPVTLKPLSDSGAFSLPLTLGPSEIRIDDCLHG